MLSADDEHAGQDVVWHWVKEIQRQLVAKGVLEPHPWKTVAEHLAKLTGGKKYGWIYPPVGKRRQRQVYPIPDKRHANHGSKAQ
jgi:hypothetical protein